MHATAKAEVAARLAADIVAVGLRKLALGREPSGSKSREGDKRTPEGRYFID